MNNRNSERHKVLEAGTISFQGSGFGIDCTVHNISIGGANLELGNATEIPDSFDLLINSVNGKQHCHVVWRKEQRIGVAFD
jgi:hypothetical protein